MAISKADLRQAFLNGYNQGGRTATNAFRSGEFLDGHRWRKVNGLSDGATKRMKDYPH